MTGVGGTTEFGSGRWSTDLGLAASLADGVAVLDPAGRVTWANQALADLLALELHDLVGSEGLALLHPDELDRALGGMVYAFQFPGRTVVVPYRIRRGDGSWLDVELRSAVLADPGGDHLVMMVRDATPRRSVHRALESVANGAPLERTAELVAEAICSRWPGTAALVSFGGADGARRAVGTALDPVLVDHAAGRLADVTPPWELTDSPVSVAVVAATEVGEPLRAAIEGAGFQGFAVAQVIDPGGEPCCVVAWFDQLAIAELEFRHSAAELSGVVALALERRHHLRQLWYVARHDSLTGLLNRTGFLERFEAETAAARASGLVVAVLYVDLDGLKAVNDGSGHAAGDRVLAEAAGRLRSLVELGAVVGRLGGDEFVVAEAFPALDADRGAALLADRAVASLVIADDATPVAVAASVGVALDDPEAPPSRTLERADAAMYRAKAAGRSRWSR